MNVTKEKESKLINIQIKMTQIVFLKKKFASATARLF